jgi:hypothetical protein
MTKRLLTLCVLLAVAGAAFGARGDDATPKGHPSIAQIQKGGGCSPKDNTARILKSANPLDFAANWSGNNYIGTGWTFLPNRYVVTDLDGGIFLQGDLLSSKGAVVDKGVFILSNEWQCGA